MSVAGFHDIQIGDIIECHDKEQEALPATISWEIVKAKGLTLDLKGKLF
jgi:hypothetical protein